MAHVLVDKSDVIPNPNNFQKTNNYFKINKAINTIDDHVIVVSQGVTTSSSIFQMNHKFTPLYKSINSIMTRLVSAIMITLPPVKALLLLLHIVSLQS